MTNLWHERFQNEEYVYGTEPNIFIKTFADKLQHCKTIGAFAEGEGRNAVFLATKGHHVTAFDFAESGLRKTKQLAEKHQVTVETKLHNLITDAIPTNTFDAAIMVFGHFPKQHQLNILNGIAGSVKSGGIIMMEMYSEHQLKYGTGGPQQIDMLYHAAQLLQWCEQFNIVHFFTGELNRNEGALHTGLAHVIQFIVQK